MQDHEILADLTSGNPLAFSRALRALLSKVDVYYDIKRYVKERGGTEDEAKDVFQDAVTILIEKVNSSIYDPNLGTINAYLFGIGKWHYYSLQRSEQRRRISGQKALEQQAAAEKANQRETLLLELMKKLAHEFRGNCAQILRLLGESKTRSEIQQAIPYLTPHVASVRIAECKRKLLQYIDQHPRLKQLLLEEDAP